MRADDRKFPADDGFANDEITGIHATFVLCSFAYITGLMFETHSTR